MVHMYIIPSAGAEKIKSGSAEVDPVYITDAEFDDSGDFRTVHSHKDTVEIGLIYEGHGRIFIDGRLYHAKPGDIVIYNANAMHQDRAEEGEVLRFFLIGIQNLKLEGSIPGCLAERAEQCCMESGIYFSHLLESFRVLQHCLKHRKASTRLFSESFTKSLLCTVFELKADQAPGRGCERTRVSELAEQIRKYIDRNFAMNFTLEELANQFHISRYYTAHVFSKAFGRSPMSYRTYRRIGEAQSLLTCTNKTVSEIASNVGYDSASRFGQSFTKLVGMSPSNYREQSLKSARRVEEDTVESEMIT